MELLLIGGGIFLGASLVDAALARGHRLTVFNRGRARNAWPEGVEALVGDRVGDLDALAGRRFDAVIDTCGYVPAEVAGRAPKRCATSAAICSSRASRRTRRSRHAPVRESDPLASSRRHRRDDRDRAVLRARRRPPASATSTPCSATRALIVRPGLIVGPGDPTGRFSHWPWRARAGGEMLVPDVAADAPIQLIDVRDLAAWMLRAVEAANAACSTRPARRHGGRLGWASLIETCTRRGRRARRATGSRRCASAKPFLVQQGVAPWNELPLWLPSAAPEYRRLRPRRPAAARRGRRPVTRPIARPSTAVMDEALGRPPTTGAAPASSRASAKPS